MAYLRIGLIDESQKSEAGAVRNQAAEIGGRRTVDVLLARQLSTEMARIQLLSDIALM
jgi:hypothetical protein